jgi:hypothetical protein
MSRQARHDIKERIVQSVRITARVRMAIKYPKAFWFVFGYKNERC